MRSFLFFQFSPAKCGPAHYNEDWAFIHGIQLNSMNAGLNPCRGGLRSISSILKLLLTISLYTGLLSTSEPCICGFQSRLSLGLYSTYIQRINCPATSDHNEAKHSLIRNSDMHFKGDVFKWLIYHAQTFNYPLSQLTSFRLQSLMYQFSKLSFRISLKNSAQLKSAWKTQYEYSAPNS